MANHRAENSRVLPPLLDRNRLRDQWSGLDATTRREVMQIFINEIETRKSAIDQAAGLAEIGEQAHGIKGSANNIGAFYLGDWARQTEADCSANARGAVKQQLKQLPAIFNRTLDEVRTYINEISQQETN